MGRCNACYKPVLTITPDIRYIDIWGGRGRGGSFFVTDYFLDCLIQPDYFRGYFMRAVYKDVRESLWQDFKDRIEERVDAGTLNRAEIHLQDTTMTAVYLPTGNTIKSKGFRKSDKKQTAKLKSIAGATHVAIEECEEVEEDEFSQLDDSLRTTKSPNRIFRIFNPPKKNHWLLQNYYHLKESKQPGYYVATPKAVPGFLSVFSRYYDNLININPTTAANFESYRERSPEYYWTTIRGLVSEGARGRIYSGWIPITADFYESLPYPESYGLDFGFSNDPTALVGVKTHNNKRYKRPLLYETGLTDPMLAERLKALGVGSKPIYADSSEPKSIETLSRLGLNIRGVSKGKDSIRHGIKALSSYENYYVDTDKNYTYEYQEYRWQLDANKEPTDTAEDKNNHYLDADRYQCEGAKGGIVGTARVNRPAMPQPRL